MKSELPPIISSMIITALAAQACNMPNSPYTVKAESLVPTSTLPAQIPTLTFQPEIAPTIISPVVRYPTQIELPNQSIPTQIKTPDVLYFSQFSYPNEYFKGGVAWKDAACGIMAGAMITKTDPLTYYYKDYLPYFASIHLDGTERITQNGSYIEDQILVMESMGYRFAELATEGRSDSEIKANIKRFTDQGFPILVGARLWSGEAYYPHITVAVDVNSNEEIVWNDPAYGERYVYALPRKIEPKHYFAVFPPGQ